LPPNCSRRLLFETYAPPTAGIYHGLNQRLPQARLRRAVSTFHDLFVLTGDYSSDEFKRRFAELARSAAERSDLIIAVSEFAASQVRDLLGVAASRIRVVPHGVLPAVAYGLPREKMILHVGAIQKRKNIVRLIEAFEQTSEDWRLVLAGSFGFGATEILGRIAASPRKADIRVPGYVSREQLARLYARASVFAFPSLDEGFGMPVLEAMAAGVPVLTSNRSALAEVSGDAAILVDPTDDEAVTSALRRLTTDEALRRDLIGRGLKRAADFTWENAVAKTWAVYQELAG
jgi:glycosyltransferase involved in cell wall biosynthesis